MKFREQRRASIAPVRCHDVTLSAERSRVIRRLRPEPSLLPGSGAEPRRIVIKEAAAILGCSPSIVRRLLNDGMLQGRPFTIRGIRVTRESLIKFIRWLEASEEDDVRVIPSARGAARVSKRARLSPDREGEQFLRGAKFRRGTQIVPVAGARNGKGSLAR